MRYRILPRSGGVLRAAATLVVLLALCTAPVLATEPVTPPPPASAAAATDPAANATPAATPDAPPAAAAEAAAAAPPPAPAAADAPPPAAAPAVVTAADAAASAAVRRVLLLPLTFTVYQSGMAMGLEAVPDWTEAARRNLAEAARSVLRSAAHLELVDWPELSAEESAALHENVGVARLIATQGSHLDYSLKSQRAHFDRSFGDGLKFLHDRTGADYAILIDGRQTKQTAGTGLMQFALAAAGVIVTTGSGTVLAVSVLDLNNGAVAWFNSTFGGDAFFITSKDMRSRESAEDVLRKLFAPYPHIPALGEK